MKIVIDGRKNRFKHHFITFYYIQGDRLLLEGMHGDMPLADNRIREHFLLDDPIRHQRGKSKTRGKRKECVTHDDCELGKEQMK